MRQTARELLAQTAENRITHPCLSLTAFSLPFPSLLPTTTAAMSFGAVRTLVGRNFSVSNSYSLQVLWLTGIIYLNAVQTRLAPSAARRFASTSSEPAKKSSSNAALYFVTAGAAGLGGYVYLRRNELNTKAAAPVQEKSPLDPNNFVDFKLKSVEPYNHNTSK